MSKARSLRCVSRETQRSGPVRGQESHSGLLVVRPGPEPGHSLVPWLGWREARLLAVIGDPLDRARGGGHSFGKWRAGAIAPRGRRLPIASSDMADLVGVGKRQHAPCVRHSSRAGGFPKTHAIRVLPDARRASSKRMLELRWHGCFPSSVCAQTRALGCQAVTGGGRFPGCHCSIMRVRRDDTADHLSEATLRWIPARPARRS